MFTKLILSVGSAAFCLMFGAMPLQTDAAFGNPPSIISISFAVFTFCAWLGMMKIIWEK